MREIKFRAWIPMNENIDVWEGYMTNVRDMSFIQTDVEFIPETKENIYNDRESISILDEDYQEFNEGNFKLMQYTGLKDKNGKEIYEGDIVRTSHGNGEIKFMQGIFWLEAQPLMEDNDICEIIGNIYENINLLKEVSNEQTALDTPSNR